MISITSNPNYRFYGEIRFYIGETKHSFKGSLLVELSFTPEQDMICVSEEFGGCTSVKTFDFRKVHSIRFIPKEEWFQCEDCFEMYESEKEALQCCETVLQFSFK